MKKIGHSLFLIGIVAVFIYFSVNLYAMSLGGFEVQIDGELGEDFYQSSFPEEETEIEDVDLFETNTDFSDEIEQEETVIPNEPEWEETTITDEINNIQSFANSNSTEDNRNDTESHMRSIQNTPTPDIVVSPTEKATEKNMVTVYRINKKELLLKESMSIEVQTSFPVRILSIRVKGKEIAWNWEGNCIQIHYDENEIRNSPLKIQILYSFPEGKSLNFLVD